MKIIAPLFVIIILSSCGNNKKQTNENLPTAKEVKQSMTDVNKTLLHSENEDIEDYAARNNWNLEKTKSGLRYMIYKEGNGRKIKGDDIVILEYELRLINNYICYSSAKDGRKEFVVGRNDEPKGLDEAMRLLRAGDKAKIIVPSHLGYGLLGDNNQIPKKAVLIYDIEIIKVK